MGGNALLLQPVPANWTDLGNIANNVELIFDRMIKDIVAATLEVLEVKNASCDVISTIIEMAQLMTNDSDPSEAGKALLAYCFDTAFVVEHWESIVGGVGTMAHLFANRCLQASGMAADFVVVPSTGMTAREYFIVSFQQLWPKRKRKMERQVKRIADFFAMVTKPDIEGVPSRTSWLVFFLHANSVPRKGKAGEYKGIVSSISCDEKV